MAANPDIPRDEAVAMWRQAVADGKTELGFSAWVTSPFHHRTPTPEKETSDG